VSVGANGADRAAPRRACTQRTGCSRSAHFGPNVSGHKYGPEVIKLPKTGWMTQRCSRFGPDPRRLQRLCETTQIRPGSGPSPSGSGVGFIAGTPRGQRPHDPACDLVDVLVVRVEFLVRDRRAGLRSAPVEPANEAYKSPGRGNALRISALWSSISGRSIATNPTSSAPASRQMRRNHSASSDAGTAAFAVSMADHARCSSSFVTAPPSGCIYNKHHSSRRSTPDARLADP